jgi:hypothetical protein
MKERKKECFAGVRDQKSRIEREIRGSAIKHEKVREMRRTLLAALLLPYRLYLMKDGTKQQRISIPIYILYKVHLYI